MGSIPVEELSIAQDGWFSSQSNIRLNLGVLDLKFVVKFCLVLGDGLAKLMQRYSREQF